MKPVIAIVGRPNVGKSTLFNRITKSRDAIVADFPGLTRDRHYGDARLGSREFIVIDTGGFEPDSAAGIVKEMARQTRQAVAEADVVVFVVDVRAGLSAQDHDIAQYLRSQRKRVVLAANKAEGMRDSPLLGEFHELGIGDPLPVSSAHGQGVRSLLEAALADFGSPLRAGINGLRVVPSYFIHRHGLVIIIALGEAIISLGLGATENLHRPGVLGAVVLGVLISATLWWTYFGLTTGAERSISAGDMFRSRSMSRTDSFIATW